MFVGWEPSERGFYLNVVDLCAACGGSGEVEGSEEVCPGCGGEGLALASASPSERIGGLASVEAVGARLEAQALPLPEVVRRDLEEDRRTNAGLVLREYDLAE